MSTKKITVEAAEHELAEARQAEAAAVAQLKVETAANAAGSEDAKMALRQRDAVDVAEAAHVSAVRRRERAEEVLSAATKAADLAEIDKLRPLLDRRLLAGAIVALGREEWEAQQAHAAVVRDIAVRRGELLSGFERWRSRAAALAKVHGQPEPPPAIHHGWIRAIALLNDADERRARGEQVLEHPLVVRVIAALNGTSELAATASARLVTEESLRLAVLDPDAAARRDREDEVARAERAAADKAQRAAEKLAKERAEDAERERARRGEGRLPLTGLGGIHPALLRPEG